ncbi:MAG: amidohydrolase family protein [Blastocatellia bacterium]|jgi:N-acyl-D-aspartate/D-glutamate deacylase
MKRILRRKVFFLAAFLLLAGVSYRVASSVSARQSGVYDLVLARGRVMDPESGLDGIRYVGVRGSRIEAISERSLTGTVTIDATGMVIAPGLIDLHSHGQNDENYRYKARDGVTTALELEVGTADVPAWYAEREGKSLINYGVTVGHVPVRMKVMGDTGSWLPRDKAITTRATVDENRQIMDLMVRGLDDGAIGIGFGIAYVTGTRREEIMNIFQLAADRGMTCFTHVRSHGAVEPGSALESMQEVVANAAATGASLHIVHVTSTGLIQTPDCLRLIDGAQRRGLDVTTEAYPYTAAMTGIETAIFDEGWQQKMGIGYGDLQWVATGERLTPESFARYRRQGGLVVIHSIPEQIARLAVSHPRIMIASDGVINDGKGHPRGAGSYARVLGRYVRDEKAIGLMEALRKMSLMPAQRLEKSVPMMRSKGRIRVGADADLIVFDPARVIDRATFEKPGQYSEGITQVIVNGKLVVRDEKLVEGVKPGMAIRRK